jgi:hypothetical protein
MRITKLRLYRWFRYFQDGFSYLSYPLTVINFMTITFYLLIDRVPFLKALFPHFVIFAFISVLVIGPLSTVIGWLHIKRTKFYGAETIVLTEANPLAVMGNTMYCENTLVIMKKLGVKPSREFLQYCEYWKKLSERLDWKLG